ncbi:hypothetical protein CEUSTIGMA_g9790.t1 [Chlamydomonas eustigma]|uniref:Uncharacterized protein n=1 Tax=Chlamydomonas eustigma TaxID=1157962 RepID=A0A250XH06_9CHLO|nr:hypothetical protein CEUSTIGMA_g9790.t1 [Chlamydomonas eustigma]|eukprot:GAX82361.1 hypothetical protein CEUSTIGMA_g9790.t1 [Chlamydomonas eustigma]
MAAGNDGVGFDSQHVMAAGNDGVGFESQHVMAAGNDGVGFESQHIMAAGRQSQFEEPEREGEGYSDFDTIGGFGAISFHPTFPAAETVSPPTDFCWFRPPATSSMMLHQAAKNKDSAAPASEVAVQLRSPPKEISVTIPAGTAATASGGSESNYAMIQQQQQAPLKLLCWQDIHLIPLQQSASGGKMVS